MILSILFVIIGFAFLIFGANWLVSGASSLAKKNNISDLVVGLTIVSFGTSAPELVVNSIASVNGFSDIILANIIGSNNFNLFIVLGTAALVYPITVHYSSIKREIPLSLFIAILLLGFANDFWLNETPIISRLDGIILLMLMLAFLLYMFKQTKTGKIETAEIQYVPTSNLKIWALILLGFAGLVLGGMLVVDHSVLIAQELGMSQKIIGLTILAIGTSLPELVTSVVAATKKNSDIAIGNVIGSNIFNILFILAVSSLIHPFNYNTHFNLDLFILIGGTIFLLVAMFIGKRKKIDRWEALILVGFYVSYTCYLVWKEM